MLPSACQIFTSTQTHFVSERPSFTFSPSFHFNVLMITYGHVTFFFGREDLANLSTISVRGLKNDLQTPSPWLCTLCLIQCLQADFYTDRGKVTDGFQRRLRPYLWGLGGYILKISRKRYLKLFWNIIFWNFSTHWISNEHPTPYLHWQELGDAWDKYKYMECKLRGQIFLCPWQSYNYASLIKRKSAIAKHWY